jgi:hypothetical protein
MTVVNTFAQIILGNDLSVSCFYKKSRRRSDALNLASRIHLPPFREWTSEDAEFQAG